MASMMERLATITQSVANSKTTIDLSWLSNIFPSAATHGSIWGYVLLCLTQVLGMAGTATGTTATPTGTFLTTLLGGSFASGIVSMIKQLVTAAPTTSK